MKGRLLEVTYEEFINNILETRGRNGCGDEYHETHHIVPKCMGGTNEEENLIDLYAREHFEAHRLLALENPENDGLVYAWWCMAHYKSYDQQRYELTSEEYEEARVSYIEKLSIMMSGEGNHFYGKHHSEEMKKYFSAIRKGNIRSKDSIEKQKITAKSIFIGSGNNFYGKHHSEETKNIKSKKCKTKKRVFCIETGQVYDSQKDVEKKTGIIPQRIKQSIVTGCCAGGYHWKYLYDQTQKDGTVIPGAITLGFITEEEALKQLAEQKNLEGETKK